MTANTYDIPGQAGKLAVVTGASDGLGLQIATRLASAGADLVLPVRNPRKGAAAVELIRAAALRARVTTTDLDLASLESVRTLGDKLLADGRPVDILLDRFVKAHEPRRHLGVFQDNVVGDVLDFFKFGARDRLGVGDVEPQSLGRNQRALLRHMIAKHDAQSFMQDVGRRMVGARRRAGGVIDFKLDRQA